MFSSADKTVKSASTVQQKAAGDTFFRKAGEESFFSAKENHAFFNKPVQAKLKVSTPDDPQEKEADAVADKVMRMEEPVFASKEDNKEEKLQSKEDEELKTKQATPLGSTIQCKKEEQLQAKAEEVHRNEEEHADAKAETGATEGDQHIDRKNISIYGSDIMRQSGRGPPATSIQFEQTLASSKGSGSALPSDTKNYMESRFQSDFSNVRIYTGSKAENLSRSINAHAFAHGNDIYFNSGKFAPHSTDGKTLLAHELTHTIQQGASKSLTPSDTASVARKNIVSRKAYNLFPKVQADNIHPTKSTGAPNKQGLPLDNKEASTLTETEPGSENHIQAKIQLSNYIINRHGTIQPSAAISIYKSAVNNSVQLTKLPKKEEQQKEDELAPDKLKRTDPAYSADTGTDNRVSLKKTSSHSETIFAKISRVHASVQLKTARSAATDPAFKAVVTKVKSTSQKAKKHDPVNKKVTEAQKAAKPPANEKASKAKDKQVAEMDQQQPGAFNEENFKAALKSKIASLKLGSLQDAEDFKKNNGAATVKGDMNEQVSSEKDKAAGGIKDKVNQEPSTGNIEGKEVGPPPIAASDVPASSVNGEQASPKPVPAEDVSLQKGSQDLDKQMAAAKVTEKQLIKSNEPAFTSGLASKKTAQQDAVQRPVQFRKDETGIIKQSQLLATGIGKTHLAAMAGTRKTQMGAVLSGQQDAKTKDEQARAKVASDIEQIFNVTKTDVEAILSQLDKDVNTRFDKGIAAATTLFEDYVDDEVSAYKEDRYLSHIGGSLLWAKDLLLGPPDDINRIYERGKDRYVKKMDAVIGDVAKMVVSQLNTAKKRINKGKQDIKTYVTQLPKDLKSVGTDAAKNIQSKFGALESSVNNKQNELVDSLAAKYKAGLDNVDKKIADMKEANKGLVDKAIDAVGDIINTIIELKNLLLNVLAKAASALDLIIEDPIGFLGNLVAGVKQGIQNFMGKIGIHLKEGLMGWLFGALANAGIQMPKSFDMQGILSLILQVLGLTYANIRARAVNIVGEKIVAGLEKAAELFMVIKNEGLGGLWRLMTGKIEQLKDTVIESIKSFVIEKIVVAGVTWLISMLNPASAFIKACKMIYDVVMFFITRGKQILDLVNAIIDSITAVAKGAIDVAAGAVENALVKALPVAISFLASLLGLDGISDKIKDIITKIQEPVNGIIDWLINKAVALAQGVAGLFTGGKDKDQDKDKGTEHSPEKQKKINDGLIFMHQEQAKYLKDGKISKADADKVAATVKSNHTVFSSFTTKENEGRVDYLYAASPTQVVQGAKEADTAKLPDDFTVGAYIKADDVFYQINSIEKDVVGILNLKAKVIRRQKFDSAVKDIQDKKYVKATADEIKELQESEFPEERKFPSSINGAVLRDHYESFGWKSYSDSFRTAEKKTVIEKVKSVQALTDLSLQKVQWDKLLKNGLVANGAVPTNYNPEAQEYQADHEPDLSLRWNNGGGRNADDETRKVQLTAPQINVVEKIWNLSKPKYDYILSVKRGFSSVKLKSPANSKSINGQPYLDKNNKPLE